MAKCDRCGHNTELVLLVVSARGDAQSYSYKLGVKGDYETGVIDDAVPFVICCTCLCLMFADFRPASCPAMQRLEQVAIAAGARPNRF